MRSKIHNLIATFVAVALVVGFAPTAMAAPPNVIVTPSGQKPAAGYVWVDPTAPSDLRVKWSPGAKHPDLPNLVASSTETKWDPTPGYTWKLPNDPKDFQVVWTPGTRHPAHPNVVAQAGEGKWTPAPGHRWASNADGDLRTVPSSSGIVAGSGTTTSGYTPAGGGGGAGPTDDDVARGALKALGAALLHQKAKQTPKDLGDAFAIGLARTARDELIKSAIDDLFPQVAAGDRATLGLLVPLALDGRLTAANLREAEAKAALVAYLKKQNADFALAAQAADFLYRVQQGSRR